MKPWLLRLSVIAALAVGTPAHGQYIYMDVNGDGIATSSDALSPAVTGVDFYLDTDHTRAGSVAVCEDGTNPLDITLYDVLIHKSGFGSVTYGGWTNAMTGFALLNPFTVAGPDAGVGYTGPDYRPPGLYKLGRLDVTITGVPVLDFIGTSTDPSIPSPATGFGSHCSGSDNPNYITLGLDFFDAGGTSSVDAVEATTWGKIKEIYR